MDLLQNMVLSFLQYSSSHKNDNAIQSQLRELHDNYLFPYIFNPLDRMLSNGLNKADVVSLIIMVAIFWVSLRVLDYARKVVMWWVSLAFRLAFWVLAIGGGWYVYNVGIEKAIQDLGWIWGLLEGYLNQATQPQRRDHRWQRQQVPPRTRK